MSQDKQPLNLNQKVLRAISAAIMIHDAKGVEAELEKNTIPQEAEDFFREITTHIASETADMPIGEALAYCTRRSAPEFAKELEKDEAFMSMLDEYIYATSQGQDTPDTGKIFKAMEAAINSMEPQKIRFHLDPKVMPKYEELLEKVTKDTLAIQKPERGDRSIV